MDGFANDPAKNSKGPTTNDFLNKPLSEGSDPAYQSLVPMGNGVFAASEPNQEVQDLQDFGAWLLNTKCKCADCGSEDHISGLCRQQDAILRTRMAMSANDVKTKELAARETLRKSVPQGSPTCKMHAEQVSEKLRASRFAPNAEAPVPESAAEGFIAQTALLPCCGRCFSNATMYQRGPPYPSLDLCLCGIALTSSDCWLCAVDRIEGTKSILCNQRRHPDNRGDLVVSCGCSAEVREPAAARKCAGCGGIVTLPTKNFAGQSLQFTAGGLNPAVELTATQQTPEPGYQSVSNLIRQRNVARNHRVFTTRQISQLRGMGLHIAAPVESSNVAAMSNPRLKLDALMEALRKPFMTLEFAAMFDILGICGFGMEDAATVSGTFNGIFEGKVRANSLDVLVSMALDNFEDQGDVGVPEIDRMFEAVEEKRPVEPTADVDMGNA